MMMAEKEKKYIYEEKSMMNKYHRKKRCESRVVE
jgi:hypothetical protein